MSLLAFEPVDGIGYRVDVFGDVSYLWGEGRLLAWAHKAPITTFATAPDRMMDHERGSLSLFNDANGFVLLYSSTEMNVWIQSTTDQTS